MTEQSPSSFADLSQRRLIFSINPGRSGSQYLSELLATAPEVCSFHEPQPTMTGPYLEMINRQPYESSRDERRIKSAAIAAVLRRMEPEQVYAETSHMFIKTFFDVVMEDFRNIEVVILRRDLAQVLKSFIEMGYFSDRNQAWPAWMSSPEAATAAFRPLRPPAARDQFDHCITYLLDIEARAAGFQRQYPNIPIHEVSLESLNSAPAIHDLFAALRITPTAETNKVCGRKVNQRQHRKEQIRNSTSLEICRQRLRQYLAAAE